MNTCFLEPTTDVFVMLIEFPAEIYFCFFFTKGWCEFICTNTNAVRCCISFNIFLKIKILDKELGITVFLQSR